jgi:high-affinity iron transporter
MLGALIIVFREVIEAGLIIGIVMAATRGVIGRGRWVTMGLVAGVVGATFVAGFAGAISQALRVPARDSSTRACLASLWSC